MRQGLKWFARAAAALSFAAVGACKVTTVGAASQDDAGDDPGRLTPIVMPSDGPDGGLAQLVSYSHDAAGAKLVGPARNVFEAPNGAKYALILKTLQDGGRARSVLQLHSFDAKYEGQETTMIEAGVRGRYTTVNKNTRQTLVIEQSADALGLSFEGSTSAVSVSINDLFRWRVEKALSSGMKFNIDGDWYSAIVEGGHVACFAFFKDSDLKSPPGRLEPDFVAAVQNTNGRIANMVAIGMSDHVLRFDGAKSLWVNERAKPQDLARCRAAADLLWKERLSMIQGTDRAPSYGGGGGGRVSAPAAPPATRRDDGPTSYPCSACGGSGQVEFQEPYEVKVQDQFGTENGKLVDKFHYETKYRYVKRQCSGCGGRGRVSR